MEYGIYKLCFPYGVHFGRNSLESGEYTFCADTLFSALCQEAVKENTLDLLLSYVRNGKLLLSDAFPYKEDEYFLPKPFLYIEHREREGDSRTKKIYRKMKYIPSSMFEMYLKGELSSESAETFRDFGFLYRKTSVSIRGEKEPVPYRVGVYYYYEGNGVYFIIGTENMEISYYFEKLLFALSCDGIGGKRSSGLGRFQFERIEMPKYLNDHICGGKSDRYMTLSVSLPREPEIVQALDGAQYKIMKRSGFVASEKYADEWRRKKDMYVFAAGSCFRNPFFGDVYDVSSQGEHAVYRYAVPMFMGVDV